ncbi:class I adenylate cyclase [Shewanella avicenniae]|uniref:Adenylate cyclase n=1 Tax=Shewanella avicenniae TaxID=2814294 RepID=A0ABX7QX24_9GAMM|nr:class I adenylate cyclase [Shewanella avicenniae]
MKRQLQFFDTAERLNRVRLARAQAILSPQQQQLFSLLPVLIHCHDVNLPGYNHPSTPSGIADFSLQPKHTKALARFKLAYIEPTSDLVLIEGVYVMGSTASFGQNPKSDVDVWLVHKADLSADQVQLLRQKAQQLTRWFAGFDFEVNFYLLEPEHFKLQQQQRTCTEWEVLGHENSGSAQHWLLLDEFYRSHIRLAGKPVVWWPEGVADPERLLYLGDMRELPASEYFGASLWQLYKGIEKPHKALLKVLLLEAYASDYPDTRLVSEEIWHLTEQENFSTENDPYLQLYLAIERYLLRLGDLRRLEIARRCFYLKCGIRLSDAHTHQDWRFHYLRKLVRDWEWPYSLVVTLDNCNHWHSGELQWFNEQINQLMLASYQTLLRFASNQRLSESFKVEDLGLLTRKLHTYFSEDKQQILRLNSLWSRSIAEPNLTIVHSKTQGCYYLYRLAPEPKNFWGEVAIYQAESIAAILAWTSLNGIANEKTQWYLFGNSRRRSRRLTRAAHRLLPSLSSCDWRVSKLELCQPWHYRKIILLLNLEDDPSQLWLGQDIMVDLLGINPLSVGMRRISLMGSLQLLTQNSWGEWHSYNFSRELGLLEAIQHIAAGVKRTNDVIDIEVFSASAKARPQLESNLRQLLIQVVTLIRRADNERTLVQPLQLRHKRYGVFFDNKGVSYRDLSDVRSLYQQVMRGSLNDADTRDTPLPRLDALPQSIRDVAVKGVVQYFLKPDDTQVDVYVLDELNQLQHYVQNSQDINELVNQVSQHYAFADVHSIRGRFNFPQFFLLQGTRQNLKVVPFGMTSTTAQSDF